MKKLITLILGIILLGLFSCGEPIKVTDPEKITTIELLTLAKKDTTTYNVVIKDHVIYAINTNTNLVEIRIRELSSELVGASVLCLLFGIGIGIVLIISTND